MPIWDADFERTNEERVRARQAALDELMAAGFTGVAGELIKARILSRRRLDEQSAIHVRLMEIAAAELKTRETFNRLLDGLAL